MTHWIQTHTHHAFDLANPSPSAVLFEDISFALAHLNRYTGHAGTYSVAEHSVLVAAIAADKARRAGHAPLEAARLGLLHDAAEAYVGDVSAPLKRLSGLRGYVDTEKRVWGAIAEHFCLPPDMASPIWGRVAEADHEALVIEAHEFFPSYLRPQPWGHEIRYPAPSVSVEWRLGLPHKVARVLFQALYDRLHDSDSSAYVDSLSPATVVPDLIRENPRLVMQAIEAEVAGIHYVFKGVD